MSKRIMVACEQFFTYDGKSCLFGGGERWARDIVSLLKSLQYDVDVYQFSYKPFSQRMGTMNVKGIGNITDPSRPLDSWQAGYDEFKRISEDFDGVFLLSMNMASQKYNKPTLSCSHGIMFDGSDSPDIKPMRDVYNTMDGFKRWMKNVDSLISVDSNTVKLSHVICREFSHKLRFIPNYVDTSVFVPEEIDEDKQFFDVGFIRRLQFCRGYQTMMKATDILLDKYDNIRVHFVGRGNPQETQHFNEWYEDKPKDRVTHTSYEMQDVHRAYKNMDSTVVSTVYAEGSSLSALESISCGIPVITTCVGGLTDVVMDGVNGIVINPDYSQSYTDPDATELVEAIEKMMLDKDMRLTMRENGLRMIKSFDKKIWEAKVTKVIHSVYGKSK